MTAAESLALMLTRTHEAMAPRFDPSPPSLAHQVATVVTVLRARRQACYGALQITDEQIEEMARAVVCALSLEAHSNGGAR